MKELSTPSIGHTVLVGDLFDRIRDLPIVSPHGHCEAEWFAENTPFPDPSELLIKPDHYLFRMLYSLGVPLEELGIGANPSVTDSRVIFRTFAAHWDAFLGTPTREWTEYSLYETLKVGTTLRASTSDAVHDEIMEILAKPEWRPRSAFLRLGIEVLATTDAATSDLSAHTALIESGWNSSIIPTFRPDDVLNPETKGHAQNVQNLGEVTGCDVSTYAGFLDALRTRRAFFKSLGATATDHAVTHLVTDWLPAAEIESLHCTALKSGLTPSQARQYYGHLLTEMAQMSTEDGLVMQLHVGSHRSTNRQVLERFGPDMGADIPGAVNWVQGLDGLLNRVGNLPDLTVILFTLDETSYSRQLAPMAGHWPCLRIGPPWWFHDSPKGIARYFDQVVETAGYRNLAGFNDDTRAFLSIPARHNVWRKGVAEHLARQVQDGLFGTEDAHRLARDLTVGLARDAYKLDSEGAL